MKIKTLSAISLTVIPSLILANFCHPFPSSQTNSTGESSIFNGELEEGAVIKVLENDTAISKGYFAELIAAFNEAYSDYNITAVELVWLEGKG